MRFAKRGQDSKWRETLKASAAIRWGAEREKQFARIRSGDINHNDRKRLLRFYKLDVDGGIYSGTLDEWLAENRLTLPDPLGHKRVKVADGGLEHRPVDFDTMRACAEIDGGLTLWILMLAGRELPVEPRHSLRPVALVA